MTTITELLNKIENHVAGMQEALQSAPSPVLYPWMTQNTPEQDMANKAIIVAQNAERIIEINRAIYALGEGKTVTQTALGDFVISQ